MTSRDRLVRPVDVWSVLLIAPVVTWLWVWPTVPVRLSTPIVLGIAVTSAGIFGIPAWFWAADRGRVGLFHWVILGAIAALGPSIAVLLSASLGLLWRDGLADAWDIFTRGAPLPGYGVLPWKVFSTLMLGCSGVGAVSGGCQWAVSRLWPSAARPRR